MSPVSPAASQISSADRTVNYTIFGQARSAPNAHVALVEVLRVITARDPAKLPVLAERVKTTKRNNIAQSPAEISPNRPELARAAEIGSGWLLGVNIANRQKLGIIRAACEVYGLSVPQDLDISLPNA